MFLQVYSNSYWPFHGILSVQKKNGTGKTQRTLNDKMIFLRTSYTYTSWPVVQRCKRPTPLSQLSIFIVAKNEIAQHEIFNEKIMYP